MDFKKKKILIVEDEYFLANHYKNILEQEKDAEGNSMYQILGVDTLNFQCITNVQAAKKVIQVQIPDLILMDIKLNGKEDGIDLVKYIQDKYDLPPPVVFITGESNSDLNKRLLSTSVNGYIKKPVDPFELCANIAMIFNNLSTLKLSSKFSQSISIKTTKKKIQRVRIEEIVYVDKSIDSIFIENQEQGIQVIRCTKSSIEDLAFTLSNEYFVRVKQYIIAKEMITSLNRIPIHKKKIDAEGKAKSNQYGSIVFYGKTESITLGRGAFREIREVLKL